MDSKNIDTIYPVILKVPEEKKKLSGRESVRFLSQYAREAVFVSAQKSGIELGPLDKDSDGAPLPSNGVFWSLSHKRQYVAGVISDCPVGIDIERIRPVSPPLINRILDNDEQKQAGCVSDKMFFRCWTGKESVLKVIGSGIRELSQCKLYQITDQTTLVIFCRQKHWLVEQSFFDNHVASIVRSGKNIQWILPENGGG